MKPFPELAMTTALIASSLLSAMSAPVFSHGGCPGGLSDRCRTDKPLTTTGSSCDISDQMFVEDSDSITQDITCEKTGDTSLPQYDDDKEERQQSLEKAQRRYKWQFHGPPEGTPYLDGLPLAEYPDHEWVMELYKSLLFIDISTSTDALSPTGDLQDLVDSIRQKDMGDIMSAISKIIKSAMEKFHDYRPTNISDYTNLHGFPLPMPESVYDYKDDEVFARYRLQGANPITIQKCTQTTRDKLKILDSKGYEVLKTKVDELFAQGKLFVVDHELLAGMEGVPVNGTLVDGTPRYLAVGIALFEYIGEEESNLPIKVIGIQLSQGDEDVPPPIFTPDDDHYLWLTAKACFEAADFIIHEVVSHLSYTHVVMEGVLVALHRQLAENHPIYTLIHPHLKGTAFINLGAQNVLIVEGGGVDQLQANDIHDSWELALTQTLDRISGDFSPEADFKKRGVWTDDFPHRYAYRDYGMMYWNATLDWVTDYLDLYYLNDSYVEKDYELQGFVGDMVHNASMTWFEELETSDDKKGFLAKILSCFIYTATVLHAGVNFPQRTAVSYVPSSGVSMFQPIPTDKTPMEFEDYLAYLPPMPIATEHVSILTLLGNIYYGKLGDYEATQFDDDRVAIPLSKFHLAIERIGAQLVEENEEVVDYYKDQGLSDTKASNFAYKTLLPDNIPMSINI